MSVIRFVLMTSRTNNVLDNNILEKFMRFICHTHLSVSDICHSKITTTVPMQSYLFVEEFAFHICIIPELKFKRACAVTLSLF